MARSAGRIGLGIVVGSLLAAGVGIAQRAIVRRAGTRLLDWTAVREIARRRLGAAGAPLDAAVRADAETFYTKALRRIEPLIAAEFGSPLPAALETPVVLDRRQWIDLNLATFEALFDRVEHRVMAGSGPADTPGRALARILNRSLGNQQLGLLLAFLGRKVLGQYDIALLAAAATARGRLAFVEPNVAATAVAMRLDLAELRTFVALHEATHAFEFEAHPWVRGHFAGLVGEALDVFSADSGSLLTRLRASAAQRGGHWLERLMTPAQLVPFRRTQALMSLMEGYANHVMHGIGAQILPGFDRLHERFERRNQARGALERTILRVTGLDLKLEQYAAGERFVQAVVAARGSEFLHRVWTGPAALPELDEIRRPARWIGRMEQAGGGVG
ncbi:MAG TPA: zinc-dependent metalloprotease [Candidatus Limnocylindria bacterium]|nr:zinc-dependent metalloprotease [Candidatus Limnocylindria bacterium]